MAELILLLKDGKEVLASKMDADLDKFVEDGDEMEILLDDLPWRSWVSTGISKVDWDIIDEFL